MKLFDFNELENPKPRAKDIFLAWKIKFPLNSKGFQLLNKKMWIEPELMLRLAETLYPKKSWKLVGTRRLCIVVDDEKTTIFTHLWNFISAEEAYQLAHSSELLPEELIRRLYTANTILEQCDSKPSGSV